jgi:Ca2+-transporting ATPase
MIWHAAEIGEIFSELKTAQSGLSFDEAKKRLGKYGTNSLPREIKLTRLKVLLGQLKSPLIYILIIAAAIALLLKNFVDAGVIMATVFLNAVVGFFEENKAEKAIEQLKSVLEYKAKVLREGREHVINAEELVPGDVILVEAGDKVMADARLFEAKNLQVNEAALTGESIPSPKFVKVLEKGASLADRENMVYTGTNVVRGRGVAIVIATGHKTELGEIAQALREIVEEKTPLQQQIGHFSKWLVAALSLICLILFLAGIWQGRSFMEMFLITVAVAVASVPEGLAISLTVILAVGMQRILKKKALVRKLVAAETLGSVSVICSDKTGTLTLGKMLVDHIFTEHESEKTKIKALEIGLLCNNAIIENPEEELEDWIISGDPIDRALFLAAVQAGLEKEEIERKMIRIDEIPFDEEKKYMATLHKTTKAKIVYLKGAPEKIMSMSGWAEIDGRLEKLTPARAEKFKKVLDEMTGRGLRVLAVAWKEWPGTEIFSDNGLKDLVLVGLVALKDPLRPEAKEAIKLCREAGIRSVLVTGDHKLTAEVIAREIGLSVGEKNVLDGQSLDKLSDEEFGKILRNVDVYARVEPRHKLRIIDAWQKKGEVVAMTGDGVNDAPALKKADVGVALGSGTDVAKEVADVVLLDDNFNSIVGAVEQGRAIFENVRKILVYFFSDGFCEVILVGGSLLLGLPLPVLAAQILWVNLVEHSMPAMALAFESEEKALMSERPRRRNESILNPEMKFIIFLVGISTDLVLFGLFYYLWKFTDNLPYARTMTFAGLIVDSLFYVWSCKSLRYPLWRKNPFQNKFFNIGMVFSVVMLFAALYAPFLRDILRVTPLGWGDWLILLGLGILNILLIEIVKYIFIAKRHKRTA